MSRELRRNDLNVAGFRCKNDEKDRTCWGTSQIFDGTLVFQRISGISNANTIPCCNAKATPQHLAKSTVRYVFCVSNPTSFRILITPLSFSLWPRILNTVPHAIKRIDQPLLQFLIHHVVGIVEVDAVIAVREEVHVVVVNAR